MSNTLVLEFFSDLISAVQSDLTVGSESSLYDATTIKLALNRAYTKIGAMFKWNETKDALKTSSIATHEYYNYPPNWRPDSIWKLTVDGSDYGDPLTFGDYQYEKANTLPSGLSKLWANYERRYFIYPTPTSDGDKNISVWGYKFVDMLTLNTDLTIFSYSNPEINEAIVLEAGAILKNKGEIQQSQRAGIVTGSNLLSQEARSIVVTTWTKISQEQAKMIRTTPMFAVPDMFASNSAVRRNIRSTIGNFI